MLKSVFIIEMVFSILIQIIVLSLYAAANVNNAFLETLTYRSLACTKHNCFTFYSCAVCRRFTLNNDIIGSTCNSNCTFLTINNAVNFNIGTRL